jgi:hypothetical protein
MVCKTIFYQFIKVFVSLYLLVVCILWWCLYLNKQYRVNSEYSAGTEYEVFILKGLCCLWQILIDSSLEELGYSWSCFSCHVHVYIKYTVCVHVHAQVHIYVHVIVQVNVLIH